MMIRFLRSSFGWINKSNAVITWTFCCSQWVKLSYNFAIFLWVDKNLPNYSQIVCPKVIWIRIHFTGLNPYRILCESCAASIMSEYLVERCFIYLWYLVIFALQLRIRQFFHRERYETLKDTSCWIRDTL